MKVYDFSLRDSWLREIAYFFHSGDVNEKFRSFSIFTLGKMPNHHSEIKIQNDLKDLFTFGVLLSFYLICSLLTVRRFSFFHYFGSCVICVTAAFLAPADYDLSVESHAHQ